VRKITITEALNELKLYDSKIKKAIENAHFVGMAKKSSNDVQFVQNIYLNQIQTGRRQTIQNDFSSIKKDDFIKRSEASYQSIRDLIKNRTSLKAAIVKSNAITEIVVNNKTMLVAEVIERKSSIEYEENLLDEMKKQYTYFINQVNDENRKVSNKIDEFLSALIGKDSDKEINKESQEAIEKPYREKNEVEFVDPIKIYDKITELEKDINGFKLNCDTQLVISNSTTYIEVDF